MLQTDNVAKYIEQLLDDIGQKADFSDKHIILYRFHAQAKVAAAYFKKLRKASRISIVDGDPSNQGKNYNGISIESPEEALKRANDSCIVIVFDHGHGQKSEILSINNLLETQIYEINRFDYADFPCQLAFPAEAKQIGLPEAQKELDGLMQYFHQFCTKYGLRYFLEAGSLLGAVRHQGFIPWDDDLDITMPMPDYLRLCELLSKECDEKYEFRCPHGENNEHLPISAVSRLLLRNVITDCSHYPLHMIDGMGLDIWALAGFPDSRQEQERYSLELEYMGDYWKENVIIPYNISKEFQEAYRTAQKKLLGAMTKYNYDECTYVGYAYGGKVLHIQNKKNRAFAKSIFAETISLKFENGTYDCPKEYHEYLSGLYGDYMQLPPIEQRKSENSNKLYLLDPAAAHQKPGSRLQGEIADLNYNGTKQFFKNRAGKFQEDNPYSVTMYQDNNKQLVVERNRKETEKILPLLKITNTSKVLDIGCGIGRWADALPKSISEYCGIDFSGELIEIAKSRNPYSNFSFFEGAANEVEKVLLHADKGKFNTILMIGILVYVNDKDIQSVLEQVNRASDTHAVICIREPIGIEQRLTLKDFYSEELDDNYNAIYRTREELKGFFAKTFLCNGFQITEEGYLFEEDALNNRKETVQYYFRFER